jgi:hypothetical protein
MNFIDIKMHGTMIKIDLKNYKNDKEIFRRKWKQLTFANRGCLIFREDGLNK